ncbi:Ctr copper transporter [Trinorchestia longiramus]|nr:Ctr copper transporter [Trinorchestia longiramus]
MDHSQHVKGALGSIVAAQNDRAMPGMGETSMPGMGTTMPGMCMCMDMDMDGMKMYFHAGYEEVILFDFWRIDEVWELLLSMLGICILAFLYEGLKHCREYLFRRSVRTSPYNTSSSNATGDAVNGGGQQAVRYYEDFIIPSSMKMMSLPHAAQTALHMLQFFIAYLLMLIFMTYNVWLCLAVLVGSGLGYFVFGWRKAVLVDLGEHCH